MAAAKKEAAKRKTTASLLPKGYRAARMALAGFFAREKGNTAEGILRGNFVVKGKFGPKAVYRIELTKGETQVGNGEIVEAPACIGLDETGYTKVLGECEPGTRVFIAYQGKGSGEKDPHIFEVGVYDAE